MMSFYVMQQIMPKANWEAMYPPLEPMLQEFGITTPLRQAMFFANVAHESSELRVLVENLNYSVNGLLNTWPTHFQSAEEANKCAHIPERIANKVYANRMGNGDEASEDGWNFRGAGALQLTGRDSHTAVAGYTGVMVDYVGRWLQQPDGALRGSGWFWSTNGLNALADTGTFDQVCDVINLGHKVNRPGASNGYPLRLAYFNTAKKILGL